jgi:hypothetical protein
MMIVGGIVLYHNEHAVEGRRVRRGIITSILFRVGG